MGVVLRLISRAVRSGEADPVPVPVRRVPLSWLDGDRRVRAHSDGRVRTLLPLFLHAAHLQARSEAKIVPSAYLWELCSVALVASGFVP